MIAILKTIFLLALCVIPFVVGIAMAFRGGESMEDSYSNSKLKFHGLSFRKYKLFMRVGGAVLIAFSFVLAYFIYLYEPADPEAEARDFWNQIEKSKRENPIFETASLRIPGVNHERA